MIQKNVLSLCLVPKQVCYCSVLVCGKCFKSCLQVWYVHCGICKWLPSVNEWTTPKIQLISPFIFTEKNLSLNPCQLKSFFYSKLFCPYLNRRSELSFSFRIISKPYARLYILRCKLVTEDDVANDRNPCI